ncbi:YHS domain-containing protein [bacterium]|nr:YHS domain-containing protein [bacterium]
MLEKSIHGYLIVALVLLLSAGVAFAAGDTLSSKGSPGTDKELAEGQRAWDPGCSQFVTVGEEGTLHVEYDDQHYYFGSQSCQDKFLKNPGQFLKGEPEMQERSLIGEEPEAEEEAEEY